MQMKLQVPEDLNNDDLKNDLEVPKKVGGVLNAWIMVSRVDAKKSGGE